MTFLYDSANNRYAMHDATGRTTFSYDELNRVETATTPANKTITYTYNEVSQHKGMIDPDGGRFTYTYDDASRTSQIENPQNSLTTFGYDDADRRTTQAQRQHDQHDLHLRRQQPAHPIGAFSLHRCPLRRFPVWLRCNG